MYHPLNRAIVIKMDVPCIFIDLDFNEIGNQTICVIFLIPLKILSNNV